MLFRSSCIGLWTKQDRVALTVRRTTHDDDMPGPVRMTSFRPDGSTLKYCSTALHHDRTMLPIALLSLFDEQRRMHRARQLVAQVPAIVLLGCFVDGLSAVARPKRTKPCARWQKKRNTNTFWRTSSSSNKTTDGITCRSASSRQTKAVHASSHTCAANGLQTSQKNL